MTEEQTGGMPLENEETVQPEAAAACADEPQTESAPEAAQDAQPEAPTETEAPSRRSPSPSRPKRSPTCR